MKWSLILLSAGCLTWAACNNNSPEPEVVKVAPQADLREQFSPVIQAQATAMAKAFEEGNLEVFAEYNHPKLIEMLGSKQGIADVLKSTMKEMEANGFFLDTIIVSAPHQVVREGNQLQCTLIQTIAVVNDSQRVTSMSNMIGVSADEGKTWKFLDTMGKTEAQVRGLLPELSKELKFQVFDKPVVEPLRN